MGLALTMYPGKAITLTLNGEHLATIHFRDKARVTFDAPRDVEIDRIDSPPFPAAPSVDAKDE